VDFEKGAWQQKWFLSASLSWDYAGGDYWLRGTMPGEIMNWLGVVVDSAHGHERLAQIYCKLRMQHSGVLKPSISQQVAEKMVARPRREQRSRTPLGNALVAAGCKNYLGSTQQNAWLFGI